MNPILRRLIAPGLLAFALVAPVQAALYKCMNANNRVIYQDRPCQDMASASLPEHLAGLSGQETGRPFMWKAVADKSVIYLLGALHFGLQDMYPLPRTIMDAFNAAQALVVEADISGKGAEDDVKKLADKGLYADKSSLEEHVKPATWRKLLAVAKTLNVSEESLRPQKPWLAMLALTGQALKQWGYSSELGLDKSFLKEAGGRIPILQMETAEGQAKLFDDLSPQEQEQILLQSLNDLANGKKTFDDIADAWKKGDVEAMDIAMRQSFDAGPVGAKLYKLLVTDRNEAMADKLAELAKDGRTYFVVVGAGHLGGEQGMLKLLEAKGYAISQP
jgi:uncharacterized protein YbaP (TraB family)